MHTHKTNGGPITKKWTNFICVYLCMRPHVDVYTCEKKTEDNQMCCYSEKLGILCGCTGVQKMIQVLNRQLQSPVFQTSCPCFSEPQKAHRVASEVFLSEWGKFFQTLPRISKGRFTRGKKTELIPHPEQEDSPVERKQELIPHPEPWWTLFKAVICSGLFISSKNNFSG